MIGILLVLAVAGSMVVPLALVLPVFAGLFVACAARPVLRRTPALRPALRALASCRLFARGALPRM